MVKMNRSVNLPHTRIVHLHRISFSSRYKKASCGKVYSLAATYDRLTALPSTVAESNIGV
jgi:hypothetical protein